MLSTPSPTLSTVEAVNTPPLVPLRASTGGRRRRVSLLFVISSLLARFDSCCSVALICHPCFRCVLFSALLFFLLFSARTIFHVFSCCSVALICHLCFHCLFVFRFAVFLFAVSPGPRGGHLLYLCGVFRPCMRRPDLLTAVSELVLIIVHIHL